MMRTMKTQEELEWAPIQDLEKWASDPTCPERGICIEIITRRTAKREAKEQAESERISERRKLIEANPFDPRTEVSADAVHIAKRIVTHLWIIFVLLPFVALLLVAIAGGLR